LRIPGACKSGCDLKSKIRPRRLWKCWGGWHPAGGEINGERRTAGAGFCWLFRLSLFLRPRGASKGPLLHGGSHVLLRQSADAPPPLRLQGTTLVFLFLVGLLGPTRRSSTAVAGPGARASRCCGIFICFDNFLARALKGPGLFGFSDTGFKQATANPSARHHGGCVSAGVASVG
jgi:hypothetical protein